MKELIFVTFDDVDRHWARQLPRSIGTEVGQLDTTTVDLHADDGRSFTGVQIGRLWTDQVGATVSDLRFRALHEDS